MSIKNIASMFFVVVLLTAGLFACKQEELESISSERPNVAETIEYTLDGPAINIVKYRPKKIARCPAYLQIKENVHWKSQILMHRNGTPGMLIASICNFPDLYKLSTINDGKTLVIVHKGGDKLHVSPHQTAHFTKTTDEFNIADKEHCVGSIMAKHNCNQRNMMDSRFKFISNTKANELSRTEIRFEKPFKGEIIPTKDQTSKLFGPAYAQRVDSNDVIRDFNFYIEFDNRK